MYTFVYLKGYMVTATQFDTYMITSFHYVIHPKGYMIVFFFTVVFAVHVLAIHFAGRAVRFFRCKPWF